MKSLGALGTSTLFGGDKKEQERELGAKMLCRRELGNRVGAGRKAESRQAFMSF